MCMGCWVEYGSPALDSPAIRAAVPLIAAVYELSCVGGGMHVQLDDWNLEDEHFDAERETYLKNDAERACFEMMRSMSLEERASALAKFDGYVEEGQTT